MDRRSFFKTMIGGVAATAAVRTFPFRVYSFPTEIAKPTPTLYHDLTALYRHATMGAEEPNMIWMDSGAYRIMLRQLRAEGKLPRRTK